MPSVASARIAARFDARPTAAMIPPSSRARETFTMRSASRTHGWACTSGPAVETAIGSSIVPSRCPSSMSQAVSDV